MENIACRFVLGFDDLEPSDRFLRLIEEYPPGGIILFSRNILDLSGLMENIKTLREIAPDTLFMIDQEGGEKSRLTVGIGFPNTPDPRKIARSISPEQARESFLAMGNGLNELGIDVNLAPVVDVAPEKHVLKNRAFSDDVEVCTTYGTLFIEAMLEAGVCPCAKHYPGLGSAEYDPHFEKALAKKDADFDGIHFVPFRRAVEAGVPAIMTTHLNAPQLDDTGEIATFSKKIIETLRTDFGFGGLILSDDLLMWGASCPGGLRESVIRALYAGNDMVLICREVQEIEGIFEEASINVRGQEHELALSRIQDIRSKLRDRRVR